jgi:hypothetical protein
LELERDLLLLTMPDGRWRGVSLNGARFAVTDAACAQRFVRHLSIAVTDDRGDDDRVDLITPPDEGAIAPRAARLPGVPDEAAVVDVDVWEAAVDWLRGGGRLGGRSVAELARLACIATPQFALAIGEWAAQVAVEMIWERSGPMRGGADLRHALHALQVAARTSPRAADALVAALACSAALRRRVPA